MIVSVAANLLALLTILPLLSFILIYTLLFMSTKDKKDSLLWSMVITTFLLVISIHITIDQLWDISIMWVLILTILLISIALIYLQYKVHKQIYFKKLLKGIISLSFILLLPLHLLLYLWVFITSFTYSIMS